MALLDTVGDEGGTPLTLRSFLRILWLQKWIILASVAVVTLCALLYQASRPALYTSTATVSVEPALTVQETESGIPGIEIDPMLVIDPEVVAKATQTLGVPPGQLGAVTLSIGNLPQITATAMTPTDAQRLANAMAPAIAEAIAAEVPSYLNRLQSRIDDLTRQLDDVQNQPGLNALAAKARSDILTTTYSQVYAEWQAAQAASSAPTAVTGPASAGAPGNFSRLLALEIGLLAGLLVGIGFALIRNWLDGRVIDAIDVRPLNRPVWGVFTRDGAIARARRPTVVRSDGRSERLVEEIRRFRTTIAAGVPEAGAVVVAVGVGRGDGASFVAANLAASSARAGDSAIVVSGDMRNPDLPEYFGVVPDDPGDVRTEPLRSRRARRLADTRDALVVSEESAGGDDNARLGAQDADAPADLQGWPNGRSAVNGSTVPAEVPLTRSRLRPRGAAAVSVARAPRPSRLETAWGATRSLGARAEIRPRLVPTDVEGLLLLPALVQGDPDSLASNPIRDLIDRLKSQSDIVVMDGPAVGDFADAQILANYADAVVLVAQSRRTRVKDLKRAVQTLDDAGVGPIGVVVNKVKRRGRA